MKVMGQKGFTLIELVLVITILGILAVSALPSFIDVSTDAELAARDGVIGAVQSGIQLYRANDLVQNGAPGNYPSTLDAVADNTACSAAAPCFTQVVTNGVNDGSWTKVDDTNYSFNDGSSTYRYEYDTATGTFQLNAE